MCTPPQKNTPEKKPAQAQRPHASSSRRRLHLIKQYNQSFDYLIILLFHYFIILLFYYVIMQARKCQRTHRGRGSNCSRVPPTTPF
jgi:hypothetical protein